MIESLMRVLENASGRSIGMAMAVVGVVIWWVVSRVKMGVRRLNGEADDVVSEKPVSERPRRRLSLRAYHR